MLDLISTARSKILLELKNRPYTASELSKLTGYSKATIFYHLEKLSKVGYVKRVERGKWVYYSLTKNGLNALRNELLKMGVLLFGGLTSLIYGIAELSKKYVKPVGYAPLKEVQRIPMQQVQITQIIPYSAIIIGTIAIILFLFLKFRNVSLKSKRS